MEKVSTLQIEKTITEKGCIIFTVLTWLLFTSQNTSANVSIQPFTTLSIAIFFYAWNFLTTCQLKLAEADRIHFNFIADSLLAILLLGTTFYIAALLH